MPPCAAGGPYAGMTRTGTERWSNPSTRHQGQGVICLPPAVRGGFVWSRGSRHSEGSGWIWATYRTTAGACLRTAKCRLDAHPPRRRRLRRLRHVRPLLVASGGHGRAGVRPCDRGTDLLRPPRHTVLRPLLQCQRTIGVRRARSKRSTARACHARAGPDSGSPRDRPTLARCSLRSAIRAGVAVHGAGLPPRAAGDETRATRAHLPRPGGDGPPCQTKDGASPALPGMALLARWGRWFPQPAVGRTVSELAAREPAYRGQFQPQT